jgi:hypothetical protein
MAFTLKSGSPRGAKSRWPIEAKARVIQAVDGGTSAVQAIATIATEFGITLKPSYTKQAGSHVFRFRKELSKILADEQNPKYAEAAQVAQSLGIVEAV